MVLPPLVEAIRLMLKLHVVMMRGARCHAFLTGVQGLARCGELLPCSEHGDDLKLRSGGWEAGVIRTAMEGVWDSLTEEEQRILDVLSIELYEVDGCLRCRTCKNPATCIGSYETDEDVTASCDRCCGHGNEDGYCRPVRTYGPE